MNISYYTIQSGLNPAVGYGYAGKNIVKSLNNLNYKISFADPKATIQLNFTQPQHFKLHRNQYQIAYTPWESTEMRSDWVERFNACDEVWTTSDWCAKVFKENGIVKPIYVYPHGIESVWTPKKRFIQDGEPIKFLHVGEPSPRKDGQLVVDTFIKLFGNNSDYHLTIKAHKFNTTRVYDHEDSIIGLPHELYRNIDLIEDELTETELVKLYHDHHVLVYPTWGEGFGFIPLQGLATGMPTISTYDWSHYIKYMGPLKLKSKLTDEVIPKFISDGHIGKMFKPDAKHLEELMLDAASNYNAYSGYYFAQSNKVHEDYNWDQLTKKAFERLSEKFS
jgi:glycosyltransferase involved in cell wall biosynthesis